MKNLIKFLLLPCLAEDEEQLTKLLAEANLRRFTVRADRVLEVRNLLVKIGILFVVLVIGVNYQYLNLPVVILLQGILGVYLILSAVIGGFKPERKKRILEW